jgi:hypothetical protein
LSKGLTLGFHACHRRLFSLKRRAVPPDLRQPEYETFRFLAFHSGR